MDCSTSLRKPDLEVEDRGGALKRGRAGEELETGEVKVARRKREERSKSGLDIVGEFRSLLRIDFISCSERCDGREEGASHHGDKRTTLIW